MGYINIAKEVLLAEANVLRVAFPQKAETLMPTLIKEFEKKYYTGLEITKDPGIYYVYAGFIMIIIGCWITFFMSHQSWFIELEPEGAESVRISLSGTSNRNPQGMKLKIRKLSNRLKEE
jgi:cytochrome c biogenesis protein